VQVIGLNTRLFIIGNATDPHIYIYSDESTNITIELLHVDGSSIASITQSLNTGINDILLGDFLNEQISDEGFYIVKIGKAYFVIIAVNTGISGIDKTNLKKALVYDKTNGLVAELPPNSPNYPYTDRYLTLLYYHDEKTAKGKLTIIDGTNITETDWARYTILQVQYKFNSITDMLYWLYAHAWSLNKDKVEAIGKLITKSKIDTVKVLGLYGVTMGLGTMLDYKVDTVNLTITVKLFVPLGFGWSTVKKALRYAGAGAIAIGGIVGGALIAVSTGGVGTIAGAALAGASIGVAYSIIASGDKPDDSNFRSTFTSTYKEGVNNVNNQYNTTLGTLDYYHARGEISDEAYNALKTEITELRNIALEAMEDLYNMGIKGYEDGYRDGYNKAKSEAWKWVAGAGAGGLLAGILVGKK